MAAENHSTEDVGLVRGDEQGGSIEERSIAALGMTNNEKQIKRRQTQEPIQKSATTKQGNAPANPKMRGRVW
jgi:hypothetical protein